MRFSFLTAAVVALAAEGAIASSWFGKAAYNKWHETELERWLSDHDVPYPAAADRKDLVDLVKNNWEENVARPYNSWDTGRLQGYLSSQGKQAQKGAEKNKDSLLKQVQSSWTETTDQASESYGSVSGWIFDSWTESQLKSFLDYHKIPNPTPRGRDSLLQAARGNYATVADTVNEKAAYPGNWLYQSWSESDLKAWLDERGIPVPQPSSRDKLIASVRRNSRTASQKAAASGSSVVSAASSAVSAATSGAASATQSLTDELLNSWDQTQLKKWADDNGIPVPQGSKKNELLALVRKHRSRASASVTSGFGAATTSAGNAYAQATNDIYSQGKGWYDWALVQVGIGSEEAKASISSISSAASSYASSVSSVAEKSASSASSVAAKTSGDILSAQNSARASVSKDAARASKSAAASAKSATKNLAASAKSLTASIKNEL